MRQESMNDLALELAALEACLDRRIVTASFIRLLLHHFRFVVLQQEQRLLGKCSPKCRFNAT